MKTTKLLQTRMLAAIALTAALSMTTLSMAGISGTKHDLRTYLATAANGTTQVCAPCHTPHNAQTTQLIPLWNHTATTATFTTYTSTTLDATPGQPTGTSKACLSCHDGTVAVDSYGGATGNKNMTGNALLGTGLANDHPVSITYDAALATADGGLVTPASASLVATGVPLFSAKVECASCHDAHDNTNSPFLRKSNTGSALCLTCHNK